MSRIDYSKWDNINTDSDSEEEEREAARLAAQRAAAAAKANAQASAQQTSSKSPPTTTTTTTRNPPPSTSSKAAPSAAPASTPTPQPSASPSRGPRPPSIPCTYAPSRGDPNHHFFAPTSVSHDHKVFSEGAFSPVALLAGLPLRIWRLDPRPSLSMPQSADMDNQRVTYLMIDPFSGFAPPEWQQGIGSVICGRQDRKPLPPGHLEAFWMFVDRLLGLFSSGDPVDPAEEMTPARFREFFEQYRQSMLEMPQRRREWRELAGPWEV